MNCTLFDLDNPFSYLSYIDATDQTENVEEMVEFVKDNYDEPVSVATVQDAIFSFGIDYPNLPDYLVDLIDTIDVC